MTSFNPKHKFVGKPISHKLLFYLALIIHLQYYGQDTLSIVDDFTLYAAPTREVLYVHLNKSHFFKGETMGFTVYTFDKTHKIPSKTTRNVYCLITDEYGNIIKKKMVLTELGMGTDLFSIDNNLEAGRYYFKAYTNYQRNFNEPNPYIQMFEVLEFGQTSKRSDSVSLTSIYLRPEGNQAIANTFTNFSVVTRDDRGKPVPYITGTIVSADGSKKAQFTTDSLGFGSCGFTPVMGERYSMQNDSLAAPIAIKPFALSQHGVSLNIVDMDGKIGVILKTNPTTLNQLKGQSLPLVFHNGSSLKGFSTQFDSEPSQIKYINKQALFTGINIFTVFDANNKPLAERIYFNPEPIKKVLPFTVSRKTTPDSISITLTSQSLKDMLHGFSISVLPPSTRSYAHNHNIVSALYLTPYLKDPIWHAKSYFELDGRVNFQALDNALIASGTSTYDWHAIRARKLTPHYAFEDGIRIRAKINKADHSRFLLMPTTLNEMEILTVEDTATGFQSTGRYPLLEEKLAVSELRKNGRLEVPRLYIQFSPSEIFNWTPKYPVTGIVESPDLSLVTKNPIIQNTSTDVQQLDEVVLTVNPKQERNATIEFENWGDVDFFDDRTRDRYPSLASYFRTKGFVVVEIGGKFEITGTGRHPYLY
ncbi:hypothetical protein [Leeuwenhoekiella parthenopeia]|uniref:MG2 domain-containing protein n=1 Tax=Leeuwenhoekiella parthenopeia TaxID=2890320 RepID=A0ABS8GYE4_9FLAO|nr:hypothetical protein [Leeuwenhoekiella parthenopeia]MCC4214690.1 hypothetical protein [Leeuwenhoekiella parthenopeia]